MAKPIQNYNGKWVELPKPFSDPEEGIEVIITKLIDTGYVIRTWETDIEDSYKPAIDEIKAICRENHATHYHLGEECDRNGASWAVPVTYVKAKYLKSPEPKKQG